MTSRTCPACGRAWIPVRSDAPTLSCPTCRQGQAPLSTKVGGRERDVAEAAPEQKLAPPRDLEGLRGRR